MIKAGVRLFSQRLGIDGAIAYTVFARLIQAAGGIVSIVFIAAYLNKAEQGYYFTFGSILAIQIFFELGLSTIITQFVAHEMAHLQWAGTSRLQGSAEAMSRLSSLLHFCVQWFAVIASILLFTLVLAGYMFFNKYGNGTGAVNWQKPWVAISIATACSLLVSPLLAFLEGMGKVKEVSIIRLIQQCTQLAVLFLCLASGLKLYASPVANFCTFLVAVAALFFSYKRELLRFVWAHADQWKVNYRLEIFPYQWRIAISWISGYFIFQLFNPVIFATEGAVAAGQMGITLAVLNGIMAVSMSWVNTKVPLFSQLIARKEFVELDAGFSRTIRQASLICALGLVALIAGVALLKIMKVPIGFRFLPFLPLAFLCAATFGNQLVSAVATYLRCHKQEPFLSLSIVTAVLTASSTIIFGKMYGVMGITAGYGALTIFVSLGWAIFIYRKKKRLWHQ